MPRRYFVIILLIALASSATAVDEIVVAEVWAELDPIIADGTERPLPREVALERLLDEVQHVVSGLVYGYQFEYVPGNASRDIQESFVLTPHATIPRGDPLLTVLETWIDHDLLNARVLYELTDVQSRWYRGWHSGATVRTTGIGRSSLFLGPDTKSEAVSDGVRDAVRNHLRTQVFTPPQLISGAVLLAEYPGFSIHQGDYRASVDILLQIDRIEDHQHF